MSHFNLTVWNVSKYGVFSGPYFPAFGLNTERYEVSLRIQSKYGEIWTRKNSVFGHFSRSVWKPIRAEDYRRDPYLVIFFFLFYMNYLLQRLKPTIKPEAYSEPCKRSKMEHFAKMFNLWKPLIIFAKRSILDVWKHSKYAFSNSLLTILRYPLLLFVWMV